ncbi:Erg26, C-3 sterol dehydrogenase [Malassezia pachydermatis]|uniref:C-3 sterol dehydrogenase (C-4 sterol decarboxylase) n=1 Tax=Malassezia pachydermatis TaxID=77020 RepID=A0A0M8MT47_9BASI|nr:c-3 sterol dehydrogenase (c-4 sterol decarboxylase) [Malassezia pachydermatis]KOS13814.1 c-3 sterol dehydrogenase (c-4 sterol decarboxylase) [Malassezia pachydermatis]
MSNSAPTDELHFVIGGAGFLGSHILKALVGRGESAVASFDLREVEEPIQGVRYFEGDLTNRDSLASAVAKAKASTNNPNRSVVVYHTASPVAGLDAGVYERVNVNGTLVVIDVCTDAQYNISKLIFTSSAGVVFSGHDLIYVDERLTYPKKPLDAYNDTKARAEAAVLNANKENGLQTVALRPAGIFGPGDRQALPGFFKVLEDKRTKWQIGDNTNLFDWTYVGNVAHAHLLASDSLGVRSHVSRPPSAYPATLLTEEHLPMLIGEHEKAANREVPTSIDRKDVSPPTKDYCRSVKPLIDLSTVEAVDMRPVFRNRFDPLFHHANPESVCGGNPRPSVESLAHSELMAAGEAFFITNAQPIPFWDFPRALWYRYNGHVDDKDSIFVMKLWVALLLAFFAELFSKLTRRPVQFTRYRVTYTACARYYNIEKARRVIGYEPIYGLEEGIQLSVDWWKSIHPPVKEYPGESAKTK